MKKPVISILGITALVGAVPILAQALPNSFAGGYVGNTDGAQAELEINPAPNGSSYSVSLNITDNELCVGSVEGVASTRGQALVLEIPNSYSEGFCQVAFNPRGDRISISERNCSEYHSATCGFDGVLQRRAGSTASPSGRPVEQASNSWQFDAYSPSAYIRSDEDNDIMLVVSCEAQMDDDDVMSLYIGVRERSQKTRATFGTDDFNYYGRVIPWSLLVYDREGYPINTVGINGNGAALESIAFGSYESPQYIKLIQFNYAQDDTFSSISAGHRMDISYGTVRYNFSGRGSASALNRLPC